METVTSNNLLRRMKLGEPVIGCKVSSRSPLMAELMGTCGCDYVMLDADHFPCDIQTAETGVRAAHLAGTDVLVRMMGFDAGKILQALDLGANGIVVSHVKNGEEARKIVSAAHYPPDGTRGFSDSSRATCFGLIPMSRHEAVCREQLMVCAVISDREGCEHVEEILDSGIDVLVTGKKNISEALGYGGLITPEVETVMARIRAQAKRRGIPLGGGSFDPSTFSYKLEEGCLMFHLDSDIKLVRHLLLEAMEQFRAASTRREVTCCDRGTADKQNGNVR